MIIKAEDVDEEIPNTPIFERVMANSLELHRKNPKNKAFIMAENENDFITFEQVSQYIISVSEWFVENGYKKGDVVLLAVNNSWRCVIFALGAGRAGLIVSAACSQFTSYEMRYQIEDSTAKLIVFDEFTHSVVREATTGIPINHFISFSDEPLSSSTPFSLILTRKPKNLPMPKLDLANDVMYLPYSSGTTGKPKGVMITHRNVAAMVAACVQAVINCVMGFTQLMFVKFDLEMVLKSIEKYKVTGFGLVPAILIRMVNSPLLHKYDLSSVETVIIGSAPLPVGAAQKLKEKYPRIRIVQGYGMTEMTLASHMPMEGVADMSIGRLVPWTSMKVKKENGELCKVGEVGELYIKGPQVMKGYWRREELMAEMFDEDGFLRTGDQVYFNEKGDTFISDRIKELIKVNARQVAPAELESILMEHDDVADVCVFGVDDAKTGERPIAAVTLKKKLDEKELERITKGLMSYTNQKLARYKHIKEIVFVEQISRTATGKLLRRNMKKEYTDARKSRL